MPASTIGDLPATASRGDAPGERTAHQTPAESAHRLVQLSGRDLVEEVHRRLRRKGYVWE